MTMPPAGSVLAAFVASAASATDGDVLAKAALDGPLTPLGAMRLALYVADADGTCLFMAGHSGGDEVRRLYSTLPVDGSTPNSVAFATGTELFLSLAETVQQYPLLAAAAAVYTDSDTIQFGALPLRHGGARVGVMGVLFAAPVPRTWESREALDSTSAVAGLWCAAHLVEIRARNGHRAPTLTQRQRAVLRLAAHGLTNSQIAAQLGFAESTVKADLTQLYRLTGATSRQDLIDRTVDLT